MPSRSRIFEKPEYRWQARNPLAEREAKREFVFQDVNTHFSRMECARRVGLRAGVTGGAEDEVEEEDEEEDVEVREDEAELGEHGEACRGKASGMSVAPQVSSTTVAESPASTCG